MRVFWSEKAKRSFEETAYYIVENFGLRAKEKFAGMVSAKEHVLAAMPEIGQVERLLPHRNKTYRSVTVNGLSKIVYYIDNDTIYIVAFWHTRREPQSLTDKVK